MSLDLAHLQSWIGRTEARADLLTPRLAEAFEATFDRAASFEAGDEAPPGIHWCLGNPALPASELGRDGHPKRQGFMPPVPLPRRMWAAGDLAYHAPLIVGAEVTRASTIAALDFKEGRTGPLIFLVIEHRYEQEGQNRLTERQTIVYRDDPKPGDRPDGERTKSEAASGAVVTLFPNTTLLFRYSALTFNGHRIHYDRAYAREVEGYPDLVVHGPLVATLLLQASADARRGARVERFGFRAVAPSFVDRPLSVHVAPDRGEATATAVSEGRIIMTAQTRYSDR
jgi:3-methylfumaryl-CoA hydratase